MSRCFFSAAFFTSPFFMLFFFISPCMGSSIFIGFAGASAARAPVPAARIAARARISSGFISCR